MLGEGGGLRSTQRRDDAYGTELILAGLRPLFDTS
jgi:hypothetical protein